MTARRMAGSVGSGGPFGERRFLFFPLRHVQTAMLKKGTGDHRHQRVSVEAFPGSTLEVVEAEFLLHLLVCLFADWRLQLWLASGCCWFIVYRGCATGLPI